MLKKGVTVIFLSLGILGAATVATIATAQSREDWCNSPMVTMWRKNLSRTVDELVSGWLDGKSPTNGLADSLTDLASYSGFLIPCIQKRGENWDPTVRLVNRATQDEEITAEKVAPRFLILRLKEEGTDLTKVQGFWAGRRFKVLP